MYFRSSLTQVTKQIQKQIVECAIKIEYPEEYSTLDKIGIENLLARKSCFVQN